MRRMVIPFRSWRFPTTNGAPLGVTFMRYIAHNDEVDYWPYVSSRISGVLNQEGTISGLQDISPSHNMQFIPYASFRNFRAVDTRDPSQPRFNQIDARGKAGLDSKFVFHDCLVLDTTINPDFAQVESDEPQNTINQRFEVFFPEKRPFFLENANFFGDTNIGVYRLSQLLFTRRIADPTFGARLTGKQGPWNLGFFFADDRSPGLVVPDFSPLARKRAYFAVGRVSHDFGQQNSIGLIYTDREFAGFFNRVGGIDANFRLNKNWTSWFRTVVSSTTSPPHESGSTPAQPGSTSFFSPGYQFGRNTEAVLNNIGRRFSYELKSNDIAANFHSDAGFDLRTWQCPIKGEEPAITQAICLKPTRHLQIDNTYILDRVLNGAVHHAAFNHHIIRSKWNYQFTPALSLRFITQYNGLLANPARSSLTTTKNLNFDFLITYLPHPGTAVYVGYSSNLENLVPGLCEQLPGSTACIPNGPALVRSNSFINDGRQFFVKISYLFRR